MGRRFGRLALCVLVCSAPVIASGQSFGSRIGSDSAVRDYPVLLVDRPLVLPRGVLEISAPLGVSLSTGEVGEPTFFNPSISYGVSDQLTVGIRHALGLCFSGTDGNCPEFYNDLGLAALYSLIQGGRLHVAWGLALNFAPIVDSTALSGELRLPVKFGGGLLALVLSPTLSFGLNERDSGRTIYAVAFNAGTYDIVIPEEAVPNREILRVPLTVQLQLQRGPALLVGASVDGELDPLVGNFSDSYRIPAMVGLVYTPSRILDLGAALTFPDLLGQDATADDRFVTAFATLRI
jgi:hypothetical protein